MKDLSEVLEHYEDYETCMGYRFGGRLCQFLTKEQIDKIGFVNENENHKPKEWTIENILHQLKEDAEFGLEKAETERGISSSLMYKVCGSWCKIINKEDLLIEYDNYGIETFKNILNFIKENNND